MSYKVVAKYISNIDFDISKPDKFLTLSNNISKYRFKTHRKLNKNRLFTLGRRE